MTKRRREENGAGATSKKDDEVGQVNVHDDDEQVLEHDPDKPGFLKWVDTLTTRKVAPHKSACIGVILQDTNQIEVIQSKGKKIAVMGYNSKSKKFLHPEEALFLLDEGTFYLLDPSKQSRSAESVETSVSPMEDSDMKEPALNSFLPFDEAYETLLALTDLPSYLVYSHLRSNGMAVVRHDVSLVSQTAGPADEYQVVLPSLELAKFAGVYTESLKQVCTEPPIYPTYDVYVRDGITSFRPSAPGPPDFYVVVTGAHSFVPTPKQLFKLKGHTFAHSAYLRQLQLEKLSKRLGQSIQSQLREQSREEAGDANAAQSVEQTHIDSHVDLSTALASADHEMQAVSLALGLQPLSNNPAIKYAIVVNSVVTLYHYELEM
jgi:tRNA-splicing endonuclease subunit sen54 N-term